MVNPLRLDRYAYNILYFDMLNIKLNILLNINLCYIFRKKKVLRLN